MPQPVLRVIPLGGLGEIGKNMMALEYQDDILVIDAGVMFPSEEMPGIDLIIPDISYLVERRDKVRAILITHGHEDHTGALPYVLSELKVPVYAPRLAHGLISVKLKEHSRLRGAKLTEIQPGQKYRFGHFRVEFFRVCHSIPDAMGIAIWTPVGLIVHTGDFKIDYTPVDGLPSDFTRLAQLASEGIFLLFSDSTYAELPGYTPSESVVGEALDRVIGEAPGRVMVATFASLISRIQQVIDAAAKHGKRVAIAGRSMVNNVKMATEMGYLNVPEGVMAHLGETRKLPPEKVVIITTGSQGEPTSVLVRMANRDHRDIQITPGDTVVISASPIPGNEVVIARTIDNLLRQGARVLHARTDLVHVHGHASQEELKLMLNLTRPQYMVPVHGEYRHLMAHAGLATSLGIPSSNTFVMEDGDVLEMTKGGGRIVDKVSAGPIYVDGLQQWDTKSVVMRDRRLLSRDGIVVVILTMDKRSGKILGSPEVVSSGFVEGDYAADLFKETSRVLLASLDHDGPHPPEWSYINSKVKDILGQFFHEETGLRPLIMPVAVEV